jgi:hypothetical protein
LKYSHVLFYHLSFVFFFYKHVYIGIIFVFFHFLHYLFLSLPFLFPSVITYCGGKATFKLFTLTWTFTTSDSIIIENYILFSIIIETYIGCISLNLFALFSIHTFNYWWFILSYLFHWVLSHFSSFSEYLHFFSSQLMLTVILQVGNIKF